jgi:hypothetical protein
LVWLWGPSRIEGLHVATPVPRWQPGLCGKRLLNTQCKSELGEGMVTRCAHAGVSSGVNMVPGVMAEGLICSETRCTASRGWGVGWLLLAPINMAMGIVRVGSPMPRSPPQDLSVHLYDPYARAEQPKRCRHPTRCPRQWCPLFSPPAVPTCK